MLRIVFSVCTSILNRIRGGWMKEHIPANKIYLPIFYGLTIGLIISCRLADGFTWHLFEYSLTWKLILTNLMVCYIGQQFPWGNYIGALTGGYRNPDRIDVAEIDEIINSLHITIKGNKIYLYEYPRIWGTVGLALRGLLWTFLLGLPLNNFLIVFSGLLMPIPYWIGTGIEWILVKATKKQFPKFAWNCGEVLYGFQIMYIVLWQLGI